MSGNKVPSSDLSFNIKTLKTIFGDSSDFQIREINLTSINKKAAVLFIDEIVDSNAVQQYILEPLMTYKYPVFDTKEELLSYIELAVIQTKKIEKVEDLRLAADELLSGKTLVIVEGISRFLSADTTKWNSRNVGSPKGQRVAKGPDVGFTENSSTNISLIRMIIKNPNVRVTTKQYGKNTHTDISV